MVMIPILMIIGGIVAVVIAITATNAMDRDMRALYACVGVILILAGIFCYPLTLTSAPIGRITVIENGSLFGYGPYDDEPKDLNVGTEVAEGDEIFLGEHGYAEVKFQNGFILRMTPGTSVVIQSKNEVAIVTKE